MTPCGADFPNRKNKPDVAKILGDPAKILLFCRVKGNGSGAEACGRDADGGGDGGRGGGGGGRGGWGGAED